MRQRWNTHVRQGTIDHLAHVRHVLVGHRLHRPGDPTVPSDAPDRFDYMITAAHDSELRLELDGTVTILTADGEYAGGVAPAWAKDATGAAVPTHYEIDGSILTQVVEHTGAGLQYPVTADPWLGGDLIASTKWTWVSGSGYRLTVTPTDWGKITGLAARGAAWTEVKAKTPGTRENTQVYEKQLLCHFDGRAAVIAREGWNATWDLEGWRPNVSYLAYVQALCNP